jgi:hypothetical protein
LGSQLPAAPFHSRRFAVIDPGTTNAQPRLEDFPDFDCGGGHMRPVDCCRVYHPSFDRFLKFHSESIRGPLLATERDGYVCQGEKQNIEILPDPREAQRIHCD